ncbi:MAG: regulator [Chlorobi bacterium]|nr:regulator [Chlorobiota bacterium]
MPKNLLSSLFLFILLLPSNAGPGIKDTPFVQEYHQAFPLGISAEANDVRTILVDSRGKVWAGTKAGLYILSDKTGKWEPVLDTENQGPVNDLFEDANGNVWIAAWNGLYRSVDYNTEKINITNSPVAVVNRVNNEILAIGPEGAWKLSGNKWTTKELHTSRALRCLIDDNNGGFYLGTGKGLYHKTQDKLSLFRNEEEILSDDVYGLDFSDQGELWIGGLGGITVYNTKTDKRIKSYTPKEGLSDIWVRCIQKAPDGTMWVGTDLGITRIKDDSCSLRHSRRWLLSDKVRDISFDKDGNAWIATARGVSAIKKRTMTLARKAAYYQQILYKRHVRKPWLVEKCRFRIPGDTTTWEPMDDDNDGQYTGMYLAMESYRYAVTKDPIAREHAIKAFHALKFLQTVTETNGFVARSVIPVSWNGMADRNEVITGRMWADRVTKNPRDKKVEKHWRKSKDGKWLWKGDTSSDEITGHMYGYLIFYDLVADSVLRGEVKTHVKRIVDYIIDNGYVLKDIDGTHTQWGVWAPDYLNDDPDWASERGINALEILSYLKLAWHVSGAEKYQAEYEKLLNKYHYRDNVIQAKSVMPAWRTYIDDELVALAYPALMLYEKDADILNIYRTSMRNWYEACKNDDSPFFYYTIDAFLGEEYKLDRSLFFLRDNPLDLIRWRVDNSKREDLTLTHTPILEDIQTSRLVPPGERGIMRWDNNPWAAVRGDGGKTESSGVYWLLAYWMGRYYGLIE